MNMVGNEEREKLEVQQGQALTYVNKPDDILKLLQQSKDEGNVVGIFALSLGPIMIMTAVDDIFEMKNDKIIMLKETDLLGIKVPEEQILLSEIVRVHAFKTRFDDPFHVRLRESSGAGLNAGLA
jgi:hypothetical protein